MKKFYLCALAVAGLLFGACTSETVDVVAEPETGYGLIPGESSWLAVGIAMPGDPITRANEDLNDGTADEYAVKSGTLYLFKGANEDDATFFASFEINPTFTNETSGKSLMVYNTSNEPADVSVITSGGSVYLKGDYNDIYLEGKSLPVESSQYPNVHGTVSVADTDQPVSLTLNFVGDDCGVDYLGDEKLTISDGVADVLGSPTIYAPSATVEMGGKYDVVTATVSENTLNLKNGFHANKLVILKGNVFVNGVDINDFVEGFKILLSGNGIIPCISG